MQNMGYRLRRDLREVLGPEITGLQRLVALEIADDANDDTRLSKATLTDLVRWTGAKDGKVVRTILKRLSEAGWEFRVPIDKGKDGRLLYAVPGKALTFRVPDWPQGVTPVTPTPEGVTGVASEATGVASETTPVASEATGVTPLSSSPHPFFSSSSRPIDHIRACGRVKQEEEEEFHQWILKTQAPRSLRWWQVVAAKDNFENLVRAWRVDRTPTPSRIRQSLAPQKETSVPEPSPEYRAARQARIARPVEPSRPSYEAAQAVLDALPYEQQAEWRRKARVQLPGRQQGDDAAVTVLAAELAVADTIR